MKVAVKLMQDDESSIDVENECHILRLVQGHPNILKFYPELSRIDPTSTFNWIAMELMGTDLSRFHRAFREKGLYMPHPFVKRILFQMLNGLDHMHKNNVIHRDVKPSNVLIGEYFNDVKLGDFGMSIVVPDGQPILNDHETSTRWYRAPELLVYGGTYGPSIDVWSAGCIMAELFLGRPLMKSSDEFELWYRIVAVLGAPSIEFVNAAPPECQGSMLLFHAKGNQSVLESIFHNKNIEADGMDLMKRMLTIYSGDRITVAQALAHPYFDSVR
jgi:serine/threonine protein kinase